MSKVVPNGGNRTKKEGLRLHGDWKVVVVVLIWGMVFVPPQRLSVHWLHSSPTLLLLFLPMFLVCPFCVLPPMVGPPREEGGVRVLAQRRSEKRFLFVGAKKDALCLTQPSRKRKGAERCCCCCLLHPGKSSVFIKHARKVCFFLNVSSPLLLLL